MNVLVTAGPTREAIDPVRFISNRSSGRMGYAVARAAAGRGHAVMLVSGPVALEAPDGVELTRVESAADMHAAVERHIGWCDVLVMAAAVADWRPRNPAASKLKKASGPQTLELERTTDILSAVSPLKESRLFIGFAAETGDPLDEARRKRVEKGLDAVVANDVTQPDAGFGVETNRVTLVTAAGEDAWPLMSKDDVARRLVEWAERAL